MECFGQMGRSATSNRLYEAANQFYMAGGYLIIPIPKLVL